MRRQGGLTVITLDQRMAAVFADLDLVIAAEDQLRGSPNQVIHYLLGQAAAIVNHRAAINAKPPVESGLGAGSAQGTGEE